MSSFREEAKAQSSVVGMHNDLAVLFKELTQNLAGAPSNALLVGLFQEAAPRRLKTNVWARLRGQKEQLTIQVQHAAAGLRINSPGVICSTDALMHARSAVRSVANVFSSACIQPSTTSTLLSTLLPKAGSDYLTRAYVKWEVAALHLISLSLLAVSLCSSLCSLC